MFVPVALECELLCPVCLSGVTTCSLYCMYTEGEGGKGRERGRGGEGREGE